MFFVYNPQEPRYTYDPEEVYQEYRRREYVAALQEQQRSVQFERELALEEERHRLALAELSQREVARRQHQASRRFAPRRPQQHTSGACACGQDPDACIMPDHQEIFRRRQARQKEEEERSRAFHRDILARIFGVPADDETTTDEPATQDAPPVPIVPITAEGETSTANVPTANEPRPKAPVPTAKEAPTKTTPTQPAIAKEPVPESKQADESMVHWSNAPDRTRSLAEIAALNRMFTSLKNTFVFPPGPLEAISDSDVPQLAYNATNAAIHAYQRALADFLSQLDGIDSFGFQGVREARKQLVVKIEQAMEELEQMITERLTGRAAPTVDQSAIPDAEERREIQDVAIDDANEQTDPSTDATIRRVIIIPETSVVTDPSPHKTSGAAESPIQGDSAAGDTVQSDQPATAPAPSVPAEQENLESQVSSRNAMKADESMPAPADANLPTAVPIDSSPAKAKLVGFSVSDEEDWEIEDAIKTIA